MELTAVKELTRGKYWHSSSVVLEAAANKKRTIDIEGQTMGLWLLTDKMIEDNNLPEVSDPILFKNGIEPTDEGLLSPFIFGETAAERKRQHAYINLGRKFFNPVLYEIIIKLDKNLELVAQGNGVWNIEADGTLMQIQDPQDQRYNENNTGLAWLVDNFRKIKIKDTGNSNRKKTIKMINDLTDDELFVQKWIVIPLFYRDVTINERSVIDSDINKLYESLIRLSKSLSNEILEVGRHLTLYKIQRTLCEFKALAQALISGKNGHLQRAILGKAVDYGGRGVISVPTLNGAEVPEDCIVDVEHSGIPLSYCISLGYPFMIKYVSEWFEEQFRNQTHIPVLMKDKEGKPTIVYEEIDDQLEYYTQKYIEKKMEMYKQTYGAERFEPIMIKLKNGKEAPMIFPGKWYGNPNDPRSNTIVNRPMTWTDVFYIAAENSLSDKYCYITRYPLEDYFGTYPSRVAVLSTIKTIPVIIDGKVYPHYPLIDLSLPKEKLATQFVDTFMTSNFNVTQLKGDYDGDTISAKILFSIEANDEADEQLNAIKNYVTIQGKLVKTVGNESILTFYNMTREE